jgi:hypothetical protein
MAFVYIFQSGTDNFFKIGMTRKDPEKRRKELSTGNPYPLTLFDLIETEEANIVENYLHKKFAQYRVYGGTATEYFAIDPETLTIGLRESRKFLDEYMSLKAISTDLKNIAATTGEELEADDEAQELRQQVKDVQSRIAKLKLEEEFLKLKLQSKIGSADGI